MTDEPKFIPFFAGTTEDGESIILYRRGAEIHIQRPDGELWALNPEEAEFMSWESPDTERKYIRIESAVWSGEASGTRKDLIEAEPR